MFFELTAESGAHLGINSKSTMNRVALTVKSLAKVVPPFVHYGITFGAYLGINSKATVNHVA